MYMPWGKYRGHELDDVPMGYLAWLLEECDNVDGYLRDAIREEIANRLDLNCEPEPPPPKPAGPRPIRCKRCEGFVQTVRTWFRRWCQRLHPDRGGDVEAMKALNELHDEFNRLLNH